MNLEIRENGVLKAFLYDTSAAQAKDHIYNGYPALVAAYEAGGLTITETEAIAPTETPEDIAFRASASEAIASKKENEEIIANLKGIIFDLESRLRVIEKKPPISIAEYKPVK